MIIKSFASLSAAFCLLMACGDSGSTGPSGGSPAGGAPPEGGSGGEAPLECGASETKAPWWCECVIGSFALSDCAADECDGQAACDVACEDAGGTTSFEVATYLPGADCDTVCGYICGCPNVTKCDVYFNCSVLPGQDQDVAEASLACQAQSATNWGCDANGNPTYNGPATCN